MSKVGHALYRVHVPWPEAGQAARPVLITEEIVAEGPKTYTLKERVFRLRRRLDKGTMYYDGKHYWTQDDAWDAFKRNQEEVIKRAMREQETAQRMIQLAGEARAPGTNVG